MSSIDRFVTRKRQASTLLGTIVIQVVATANTLAFPVLVPSIPDIGIGHIGVFMMVVYVGAILGAASSGAVIARLGPLRASQWALVVQALGLSCVAWAGDVSQGSVFIAGLHWLGALLCGLGYGPVTPASSQMLVRITAESRASFVFSLKQTGVPLGGLIAGLVLLPIAGIANWKVALLSMIALSFMVALVVNPLQSFHVGAFPGKPGESCNSGGHPMGAVGAVMRDRRLRSTAAVSLLFSICQLCVGGFLVVYLHEEVGFDPVEAGRLYALTQFAGIVGRLGWGRLADVTGAAASVLRVLSIVMAVATLATGLLTADWPQWLLMLVVAVLGGTAIGWNGVFLGEIARLAPQGTVASITGGVLAFT